MSATVLQAKNVGVRFAQRHGKSPLRNFFNMLRTHGQGGTSYLWALRDVSFDVKEGEILGIIGRNGAGKSTLFLVLSQILDVDEGQLDVNGEISTLLTINAGFRGDLTGRENLYLSAALVGIAGSSIAEVEDDIIQFAELEEFIDEPLKTYSSGMRARLGFSVAVHVHPDILLMDEVLGVGDESFRVKSLAKIHSLLGSARAILVVSHSMTFVREHCSRVIWIERGRLHQQGDPDTVVSAYIRFCQTVRRSIDEKAKDLHG